jgi:hypothetical protein
VTRLKRDMLRALGAEWTHNGSYSGRTKMVFQHKASGNCLTVGVSPPRPDEAIKAAVRRAQKILSGAYARRSEGAGNQRLLQAPS